MDIRKKLEIKFNNNFWLIDYYRSRRKIPLGEVNENKPAKFCGAKSKKHAVALPIEKDERKLATRQRQIEIGKNTPGYKRYLEDVPRYEYFIIFQLQQSTSIK